MPDLDSVDASMGDFSSTVDKDIVVEASRDAWVRPGSGDAVVLEVRPEVTGGHTEKFVRRWILGHGPPLRLAGLDLESCVQTMRVGEEAVMKLKDAPEPREAVRLRLHSLERREDLGSEKQLVRLTLRDGISYKYPQAGNELRVRYSWRPVGSCNPSPATDVQPETALCSIIVASVGDDSLTSTNEFSVLQRDLIQHFGGAVEIRVNSDVSSGQTPSQPLILTVKRGDETLASNSKGMSVSEAREALSATLGPKGGCGPKEVMMNFGETGCKCDAPDWLPEAISLKAFSEMREGQRCLIRIAPELLAAQPRQAELLPKGAHIEYDVELLQIYTLEDVSLDGSRSMLKKLMKAGEGVERAMEGADVTMRVEVRSDPDGAVLVEERDISFQAASETYCAAIAETVLTMRKGEVCEVRCVDPSVWADKSLGLAESSNVAVVVFALELLEMQSIDLYTMEEPDRVAFCSRRKETGTKFFVAKNWRRALQRYSYVSTTLKYIDHWTDASAKDAAVPLRRTCQLNAAACQLKLSKWAEARDSCDAVLKDDPSNLKALFRKGEALKELSEFSEAERCLRSVYEMDTSDQKVGRLLRAVRQSLKEENAQQKAVFSRMAKGIGAEAAAEAPASVPTSPVKAGDTAAKTLAGSSLVLWSAAFAGAAALAALGVALARRRR